MSVPTDRRAEIAALIDAIGSASPTNHGIVLALRAAVQAGAPIADEMIKYGGLHYIAARPICGIFAFARHVTLEFSRGAELDDPAGVLLGDGQYRRHIRFVTPEAVDAGLVTAYVAEAVARA